MRTRLLISMIAACAPMLFAEPPAGQKPPTQPGQGGGGMLERMKDNMPPELRARFEAARAKAMQDPAVLELKKKADASAEEFRKAMREAMMKADPGLADLMKEQMGKWRDGKDGKRDEPPGFSNLSDNDRQKLMAAREKAKSDPALQSAEAKKNEAKTPEERHAAMEEFHKAMKAAILKADPTLAPILEQLKPPQGQPPKPGMEPGA
ncbi:MAG: hypothetical protein WCS65_03545 [Verrucomicrobiae bacterium]